MSAKNMEFEAFLRKYSESGYRVAQVHDNGRLLDYYHGTGMKTGAGIIRYDRGSDYFRFLKFQGTRHLVLLGEDKMGRVSGLAGMSFRPGYLNGKVGTIGFLGDLRISPSARTLRPWRGAYADLLKGAPGWEETGYCRACLTAVIKSNVEAERAVIRPKVANYRYDLLASYRIVNVFGAKPGVSSLAVRKKNGGTGLKPEYPEAGSDVPAFLDSIERSRPFGYAFLQHEWEFRQKNWPGLSDTPFMVFRQEGKIKAVAALWSPGSAKCIIPGKIPRSLRMAGRVAGALSGHYREVFPRSNEPMKVLYVTHLAFCPELSQKSCRKIFSGMLREFFRRPGLWSGPGILAFSDFMEQDLCKGLGGFFYYGIDAGLYSVRHDSQKPLALLKADSPGFEMCMV